MKTIEYFRMPLAYNKVTAKYSSSHKGIDLAHTTKKAYGGTYAPVYAPFPCKVNRILKSAASGNIVELKHDYDGYTWFVQYKHLKSISVKKGAELKQGDAVGKMGNTGTAAKGVHLHYALWRMPLGSKKPDSKHYVSPLKYTFAYDNQVTAAGKDKIDRVYGLPVARDEAKKQIKVTGDVNCRKTAKGTVLGPTVNGIYNYSQTVKKGSYTWYCIAEGRWVANVKNKVEVL